MASDDTNEFIDFLRSIEHLSVLDRDRRIGRYLSARAYAPEQLKELVYAASSVADWATNAVLTRTPPAFRQLPSADPKQVTLQMSVYVAPGGAVRPPGDEATRDVALIGYEHEHSQNLARLTAAGFSPLVVKTIADVRNMCSDGLCGVVVAPSFWRESAASSHLARLKELFQLSSFWYVRIDTLDLDGQVSSGFIQVHEEVALAQPIAQRLRFGDSQTHIDSADVKTLAQTARLVSGLRTPISPAGLNRAQLDFLRALMSQKPRANDADPITVRELPGGKSLASVYLVSQHQTGSFMAVKFGAPELLAQECRAFREVIEPWSYCGAAPSYHYHLDVHALSYPLAAAPEDPGKPASTLHDHLERLATLDAWADDSEDPGSEIALERNAQDTAALLNFAVVGLHELNARPRPATAPAQFWLDWPVRSLAKRSVSYEIESPDGAQFRLEEIVQKAVERVARLDGTVCVHGDVHSRNILVRDRLPVFIDFCNSSAGHPCLDMARLDGVVRVSLFRMTRSERHVSRLFRDLYCDGDSFEVLMTRYPDLVSSTLSKTWLGFATSARDKAVGLATKMGGDKADFLAMTAIVAAHLLVKEFRTGSAGTERAILAALADASLSW